MPHPAAQPAAHHRLSAAPHPCLCVAQAGIPERPLVCGRGGARQPHRRHRCQRERRRGTARAGARGRVAGHGHECAVARSWPGRQVRARCAWLTHRPLAQHTHARARAQEMLSTPRFRCYRTHDVTGVELGGALKNVLAIACGISDGLGFGSNGRAALMTRGLDEITRLAGGWVGGWVRRKAGHGCSPSSPAALPPFCPPPKLTRAPPPSAPPLLRSGAGCQPADAGGAVGRGRHRADLHRRPVAQPHRGCAAGQGREAGGHHRHHGGALGVGQRLMRRDFGGLPQGAVSAAAAGPGAGPARTTCLPSPLPHWWPAGRGGRGRADVAQRALPGPEAGHRLPHH